MQDEAQREGDEEAGTHTSVRSERKKWSSRIQDWDRARWEEILTNCTVLNVSDL